MTQLKKRLQKLEKAQAESDPYQIAKRFLSDEDRRLLEQVGFDRDALGEANRVTWFRWESALDSAKEGRSYVIPVLDEVLGNL